MLAQIPCITCPYIHRTYADFRFGIIHDIPCIKNSPTVIRYLHQISRLCQVEKSFSIGKAVDTEPFIRIEIIQLPVNLRPLLFQVCSVCFPVFPPFVKFYPSGLSFCGDFSLTFYLRQDTALAFLLCHRGLCGGSLCHNGCLPLAVRHIACSCHPYGNYRNCGGRPRNQLQFSYCRASFHCR